jgi:hypothetical protein
MCHALHLHIHNPLCTQLTQPQFKRCETHNEQLQRRLREKEQEVSNLQRQLRGLNSALWSEEIAKAVERYKGFVPDPDMQSTDIPRLFLELAGLTGDRYKAVLRILEKDTAWSKWLCVDVLASGGTDACQEGCGHTVQVMAKVIEGQVDFVLVARLRS